MSAREPSVAKEAPRDAPVEGPLVVAFPLEPAEEAGLARISWARTTLRLAAAPEQHPWSARWKLRRRTPLALLLLAALLLFAFALSGCASVPPVSLLDRAPAPTARAGPHCETLLFSHDLQIAPAGELSDLRLTLDAVPEVLGKLRVLVRRPRFPAKLELGVDRSEFDKVLELDAGPGQHQLTLLFQRPDDAKSDWPRRSCKACRIDAEVSGLFGAREGLTQFFAAAARQAQAIDAAFARQEKGPLQPGELLTLHERLSAEASRCGVSLEEPLRAVEHALIALDDARAQLYAGPEPLLPDAAAVQLAFTAAQESVSRDPLTEAAAREGGWPASLRGRWAGRLRASVEQLDLAAQAAQLAQADRPLAARWIALAAAPDAAALEQRISALPPIRDLAEAEARLDWVDPKSAVRLPGASRLFTLRVAQFHAARHGRRCIGPEGAAPVRDPAAEAQAVSAMLGLRPAHLADLAAAQAGRGRELLCAPPQLDASALFEGLDDKELGVVAARLEGLFAAASAPGGAGPEALRPAASQLLCKLFEPETIARRVRTVAGYKVFVEGGTHLLELVPGLRCHDRPLAADEVRRRLRTAYREALDLHAVTNRLCPQRAGKCPEEVAASVRRIFSLERPALAGPAQGDELDFPPPFGFSEAWVQKLDRCAREACASLASLRSEAPGGQFDGPVCAAPLFEPGSPQEVQIDRPEAPVSVTLQSCDAHERVLLTLRRRPEAGTLVSIASAQKFSYGSERVSREGRHPQLGRIYERVSDLSDPNDVSRRSDGSYEVALTPTVQNQVFYFFSLRRRDY